jgi:hypothetical protein
MFRSVTLFCALIVSFFYSQFCNAQPPYPLSPEDWKRIQQHLMQHFYYGRPYQEPYVFRLASVDQQFIPVKENISESVYGPKEVRQSFATKMPYGNIESIAVYLKQAPLSTNYNYDLDLELYEAWPNSGGAPKQTILTKAKAKATNTSSVEQTQWVTFELKNPVKSWLNRQLVIVLSTVAPPGVFSWVGDDGDPYPRGQGAVGTGFRPPTGIDFGFKAINVR